MTLALLLSGLIGYGPDADAATVTQVLRDFKTEVTRAYSDMEGKYEYANAPTTLRRAAQTKGAPGMDSVADAWGQNGLYLDWNSAGSNDPAETVYRDIIAAIDDSLRYFAEKETATSDDVQVARNGAALWRNVHQRMQTAFDELVGWYVESARYLYEKSRPGLTDFQKNAATAQYEIAQEAVGKARQGIRNLATNRPFATLRIAAPNIAIEQQSSLIANLNLILRALDAPSAGGPNSVFWVGAASPLDQRGQQRLTVTDSQNGKLIVGTGVTVQRKMPDGSWVDLATGPSGAPVSFSVREVGASVELAVLVQMQRNNGGHSYRSRPQTFTVHVTNPIDEFESKVLVTIADAIYHYKQVEKSARTYGDAWAAGASTDNPLSMRNGASTGKPLIPMSGDVVLRTGGPLSSVMGTMGSPAAPQTHAGILWIEVLSGSRKIHWVLQVVPGGYEEIPLGPADAMLARTAKGLAATPKSFVEGASVGTVEIYRPLASVDGVAFPQVGAEVAARARAIGRTVTGYDYMFMEKGTSILAGESPFSGLFYCNEFVRDAFGVSFAEPVEVPLLRDFWRSALAADAYAAQQRIGGTSVSRLMTRLEALPLNQSSLDPATARSLRELIATIQTLASGTSVRQLVTNEVQKSVDEKLQSLAPAPVSIGTGWKNLAGMFVQAQIRNWVFSSSYANNLSSGIARQLVNSMVADMGDALTTREILAGGLAPNDAGAQMRVAFTRIDN